MTGLNLHVGKMLAKLVIDDITTQKLRGKPVCIGQYKADLHRLTPDQREGRGKKPPQQQIPLRRASVGGMYPARYNPSFNPLMLLQFDPAHLELDEGVYCETLSELEVHAQMARLVSGNRASNPRAQRHLHRL